MTQDEINAELNKCKEILEQLIADLPDDCKDWMLIENALFHLEAAIANNQ